MNTSKAKGGNSPRNRSPLNPAIFNLPGQSRALEIRAPQSPPKKKPIPPPIEPSLPGARSSSRSQVGKETAQIGREISNTLAGKSVQNDPKPLPGGAYDRGRSSRQPQQANYSTSTLDIYAPIYVPVWLRAVNDSVATTINCPPLRHQDLNAYVRTFTGSDFITDQSTVTFPDITTVPQPWQVFDLCPRNYYKYFAKSLQNEIASQATELRTFFLYDVLLELEDHKQQLFRLSVPGLRENSPLLELGDVLRIRSIPSMANNTVIVHAQAWYDSGANVRGITAPGFDGLEYQAVVWAMAKTKEQVLLRLNNPTTFSRKVNVVFLVQEKRWFPPFRSLKPMSDGLAPLEEENWLRHTLFPKPHDAIIQTTLNKGTFNIPWYNTTLNFEQQKAVAGVLEGQYGTVPYLVSGPPGTGKTSTIVEMVLQILHPRHYALGTHLLVCTPSQSSADTIARRLRSHFNPFEMFRLNNWTRSFAEVPEDLLPYCFVDDDLFSIPPFKTMMSFKVVVTTCRDADLLVQAGLTNVALDNLLMGLNSTMLQDAHQPDQQHLHWTGLLLDEAAQAMEPEVLIPLNVVNPGAGQMNRTISERRNCRPLFVMAGDEFQLGPRLSLKNENPLECSLFERLFQRPFYAAHPLARTSGIRALKASMLPIPRPAFTNLVRNYRSHPAILAVPSSLFYHDTLMPEYLSLSGEIRSWPGWTGFAGMPVLFAQNSTPDDVESVLAGGGTGAGALVNHGECHLALATVQSMLSHANSDNFEMLPQDQIKVMSPFRAQVQLLRNIFRQAKLARVDIGPLEAYQGLEGRVVLVCTTRTRIGPPEQTTRYVDEDKLRGLGLIDEPKRFNVSLTRAKEALIVIGDARCLTSTGDPCWHAFIAFCRRNDCVKGSLPDFPVYEDEKIGRLERAMRYAVTLKNPDRARRTVAIRSQRAMRGPILGSDEMMWANGMTEIEDEGPGPEDTFVEEAPGESQAPTGPSVSERTLIWNDDSPLENDEFYQEMVKDFNKADCATQ